MAKLEISGMDDLNAAFGRIKAIPHDVTSRALASMADIAAREIRLSGESMGVRDPESDVHILDRIKPRKPKKTAEGGYEMISFTGTRRRGNTTTRNAEIAFVNEYGKQGQPARPFIGTAMNRSADRIQDQAEKVIGDWIENEFNQ